MNLEKVRKPVRNGGIDCHKGCNRSVLWQGGTSLLSKVNPQWNRGEEGWGILGWWQKAQRRRQQGNLGLFLGLPRQELEFPRLAPPPQLSSAARSRWHTHQHSSPCALPAGGKAGSSGCLFPWLTTDRLHPTAHLQSACQPSPAHCYGNPSWLRDAGHHWLFLLSPASQRRLQPRAALLPASASLLLQLPHLHPQGWAHSASSFTQITLYPLPPSLVMAAWNLS